MGNAEHFIRTRMAFILLSKESITDKDISIQSVDILVR